MRKIVIGFSKPKKQLFPIVSWLIRLYMGTPYSHVFLKFYSQTVESYIIYESIHTGVRFVGTDIWQKNTEVIDEFSVAISDDQYKNLLKYCVENAGKPYGFLQNLGIVISNLLNLKQNILSKGGKRSNCSEEIALILISLGYQINKSPDLVTPRDIYEILSQYGVFNK